MPPDRATAVARRATATEEILVAAKGTAVVEATGAAARAATAARANITVDDDELRVSQLTLTRRLTRGRRGHK